MGNMRRNRIGLGVLAVLALASCTREMDVPESQQLEFRAVWAEEPGTRTAIQSDGTSVWWTPGEEINAFYGNRFSGKFISTNTTNKALVSFQGMLTVLTGTAESGNAASSYWAVYPYDASNACDGESVTLTVPSEQSGIQGTFADKMFPAIATSQSLDLAFYNVCGGARFSVTQPGIISVTFKSNGGEPIAGKVKVGFGADGLPEVRSVLDGKSEVKVVAPAGGFVPGQYYYAAFLPQTLAVGLSMKFETSSHFATYTTQNSITVNRSRFGKLDGKDNGLTYSPIPVDSVSLNKTSLIVGIGGKNNLQAIVYPENAADRSVSWSSSDESVATVSSTGLVTGVSVGSAVVTVTTTDGAKTATCNVAVVAILVPEAVDLGLSVKWASFNLGASAPEEYGDYFAWGETVPNYSSVDPLTWKEGKENGYAWPSYKWCEGFENTLTKYCDKSNYGYNSFTDTRTVLEKEDDAAAMTLGDNWRIPTNAEWAELMNFCTSTWTTRNGVNGRLVTATNGNSIFFPAAGYWWGDDTSPRKLGSRGYYWSSDLYVGVGDLPYDAWDMFFDSYGQYMRSYNPRFNGFSVRPVSE